MKVFLEIFGVLFILGIYFFSWVLCRASSICSKEEKQYEFYSDEEYFKEQFNNMYS